MYGLKIHPMFQQPKFSSQKRITGQIHPGDMHVSQQAYLFYCVCIKHFINDIEKLGKYGNISAVIIKFRLTYTVHATTINDACTENVIF